MRYMLNDPLFFLYLYQDQEQEKEKLAKLGGVCLSESGFWEITFQTFLCLFAIRKVGQQKTLSDQRKTLSSQMKICLGFQKSVFLLFWTENTFRKLWKI